MAVGLEYPELLHPVAGVRLASGSAGIRKRGGADLVLMELGTSGATAAVFTRNQFCAAPVVTARSHLEQNLPRYLLINAGNANAGTGQGGLDDAVACCTEVAELTGCVPAQVLPFSTGVIGEPLPVDQIRMALPALYSSLAETAWLDAAKAVMTTDTVPKAVSRRIELNGGTVTVTGIAKGAGMIRPDMATMLAFIATDAVVDGELLQRCLDSAVNRSFNRISVDGDTSTNDACVLCATGASGIAVEEGSDGYALFMETLTRVCESLAQAIVRDGEGATKFVTVDVCGGRNAQECLDVAYAIAHSPLVKTALFASDPNWGRILAVVGRAGVDELAIEDVTIHLGDVCIVRDGGRAPEYTEAAGQRVMSAEEITIQVDLARGNACERVWTTDLSYDYVRINAEYRT